MAVSFFPAILLLLLFFSAFLRLSQSSILPPFQPPSHHDHLQLKNIIDTLSGSGEFAGWINLLSSTDPSTLPITATLFIPSNDAITRFSAPSYAAGVITFDPYLVPYHIVPQRLTFDDLRHLAAHTRLPTLLPSKYILITNNSPWNYSIDNTRITHADIFITPSFSAHGIEKVLEYSLYGNTSDVLPPIPQPPRGRRRKTKPTRNNSSGGGNGSHHVSPAKGSVEIRSDACCPCTQFLVIVCSLCAVLGAFNRIIPFPIA